MTEQQNIRTEADAVAAITLGSTAPVPIPGTDGRRVLVAGQAIDVSGFFPAPQRVTGYVEALTIDGLIDYAGSFVAEPASGEPWSRCYLAADPQSGAYIAEVVLDDASAGAPAWRDHVVRYDAQLHPDWQRWAGVNGAAMPQEDFLEFLIDNEDTIVKPAAAELLELVAGFQQITTTRFESAVNVQNGLRKLTFREDDGTPQEVRIPEVIEVGVPVYRGGEAFKMQVRVKTRARDGEVRFSLQRVRPDRIIAEAQKDLTEKLRDALDIDYVEAMRPGVDHRRVHGGAQLR